MTSTIEIDGDGAWTCGAFELMFDGSSVTLYTEGVESSHLRVPDLTSSDYVEVWCSGSWGCCMGLNSEWVIWFDVQELRAIGPIERLVLDGYDPGGLRRVAFVPYGSDAVLVFTEVAVALIDAKGRMHWRHVHDRLTAQFTGVADGIAWFDDEGVVFGVELASGSYAVRG